MIIVLLFLWISAALGYILRRHPMHWVSPMTTYIIWLLLFLLGMEVGSNRRLIASLGTLGAESAIAAVFMVAGSCLAALLFQRSMERSKLRKLSKQTTDRTAEYETEENTAHSIPEGGTIESKTESTTEQATGITTEKTTGTTTGQATGKESNPAPSPTLWHQMKDSLVIVGFFLIGLISGYSLPQPPLPAEAGYWTLCLLMGSVGFSIGQNDEVRRNIRHLDRRLMLLPLVTVAGTWGGMLIVCVLVPRIAPADWMAIGSGFGYYSLSGIMVSELRGAEIGTIALMSNILREIITLTGAPLLCRWFGPLAPITAGGCTTEDTTLPVIARVCGREMVPVSIFHGLTIDFSVPFLISFFCSLA